MALPPIQLPRTPKGLKFEARAVVGGRFDIQAATDAVKLTLTGVLGLDFDETNVADALAQAAGRPVVLDINSPGGSYWSGVTSYNLLRGYSGQTVARIVGVAASAASILAIGAQRVEIARNGELMIHRPASIALGTASDMAAAGDYLTALEAALAQTYAARTGRPVAEIMAEMQDETSFLGQEAVAAGFADGLLPQDAAPPPEALRSAVANQRDLAESLRALGLSRREAAVAASAAWPAIAGAAENEIEDSVLDTLTTNARDLVAALMRN